MFVSSFKKLHINITYHHKNLIFDPLCSSLDFWHHFGWKKLSIEISHIFQCLLIELIVSLFLRCWDAHYEYTSTSPPLLQWAVKNPNGSKFNGREYLQVNFLKSCIWKVSWVVCSHNQHFSLSLFPFCFLKLMLADFYCAKIWLAITQTPLMVAKI